MENIEFIVSRLNTWIWDTGINVGDEVIPWVVIALLGTGVFLTLRLGFIQLRRRVARSCCSFRWPSSAI